MYARAQLIGLATKPQLGSRTSPMSHDLIQWEHNATQHPAGVWCSACAIKPKPCKEPLKLGLLAEQ